MGLLVGNVIRHAGAVVPGRLAATMGAEELTFAQLEERTNQVARALAARGVRHGDRVAWWGETGLAAMPVFGALAKLGAAFMPVNARLGVDEAETVVGYARPNLTVVDEAHEGASFGAVRQGELFAEASRLETGDVDDPALQERDAHVIFFTSGSTGRAKGVVLSHRTSFLRSFPNLITDWTGGTVCMFPLFHMSGWSMALNAWQMRLPVHLAPPDPEALLSTAQRRQASRLYCLPAVWSRVLDYDRSPFDLGCIRECDTGTSATPPELLAAIKAAFPGTATRIYYGSTEAGPATLLGDEDLLRKPGSVGLPAPGVDLRLGDDGEVCVRSEFLMDGYFEQPDATAAALIDGWYHTGDLGALDDEGYLSIVGRARDVLRTGGETVAPGEVEAVLADHPDVAEVAVVGLPDVRWGEVVCAVVVPAGGRAGAVSVESLRAHCEGRLASFKQPRRVELVEELPRTPATAQIQRTLLVARLTASRAP
ncbi:MAG TPA: AMP-binding protein [Acidimicrobiia bacterium]|nr:AMP-binding protein [Acidimicrobiia bacterium]